MQITVNGRAMSPKETTLFALRSAMCPEGEDIVTIVDGYQTAEDIPLDDGMDILFIPKGVLPERDQLEKMMMARLTPGVYDRVRRARVAVAGLGGLGSTIALHLARTGVGCLHLVDFDIVEPSNLNRQQYAVSHLGMPKAEAMKRQIGEINPFVRVIAEEVRVTRRNAPRLFAGDDIICEAFDRPEAKAELVEAILANLPEKPVVAASGMAGIGSGNEIVTRRVGERLYLCGDGHAGAEIGRGLMSPRVGICAGHQANMVLRLILGETDG